jgi:hypothetical protein
VQGVFQFIYVCWRFLLSMERNRENGLLAHFDPAVIHERGALHQSIINLWASLLEIGRSGQPVKPRGIPAVPAPLSWPPK